MTTKAQRGRLEKLAAYLEGLPEDYEHFDMREFFGEDGDVAIRYARENGGIAACGTVACAVGHGPAAGILFPKFCFYNMGCPDWVKYSYLFTPDERDFDWCFTAEWHHVDNSPKGAAARIRYMLHEGSPPDFRWPANEHLRLYAPYRIDAKVST